MIGAAERIVRPGRSYDYYDDGPGGGGGGGATLNYDSMDREALL
jgi:hypothetical protein